VAPSNYPMPRFWPLASRARPSWRYYRPTARRTAPSEVTNTMGRRERPARGERLSLPDAARELPDYADGLLGAGEIMSRGGVPARGRFGEA
jgi:hypothetical protein